MWDLARDNLRVENFLLFWEKYSSWYGTWPEKTLGLKNFPIWEKYSSWYGTWPEKTLGLKNFLSEKNIHHDPRSECGCSCKNGKNFYTSRFTEILENMGLELMFLNFPFRGGKRNNYWVLERSMAKFSCNFREKFPLTVCLIKLQISGSLFRFFRVVRKIPIPINSPKR